MAQTPAALTPGTAAADLIVDGLLAAGRLLAATASMIGGANPRMESVRSSLSLSVL